MKTVEPVTITQHCHICGAPVTTNNTLNMIASLGKMNVPVCEKCLVQKHKICSKIFRLNIKNNEITMVVAHNGLLYMQERNADDVFHVSFYISSFGINRYTHILNLNSYVGERISFKTLTEILEQQTKKSRSEIKHFLFKNEDFIKWVYENLEKSFNCMNITVKSMGL